MPGTVGVAPGSGEIIAALHATGLAEVARIRAGMEAVRRELEAAAVQFAAPVREARRVDFLRAQINGASDRSGNVFNNLPD